MIPGLVSAIVPVYNRPMLLEEAVSSVLRQTYPFVEVIIIDDGSTDETVSVSNRLATEHPNVIAIHRPHDGRPGVVREAGRSVASGEYIQYLDSDDLLLPRKFEFMVKALVENPDCDVAYCYTRRYVRGDAPRDAPCELTGETFEVMLPRFLSQRFWHTCTPLFTRRICDKIGPWSSLPILEDFEYDIRIATLNPRIIHCKEFLADFRDHDDGRLSKAGMYIDRDLLKQMPRAYALIYGHVRTYGLTHENEDMQLFIARLRWIAERCAGLGLIDEARECYDVVRDATGKDEEPNPSCTRLPPSGELSSLVYVDSETLFAIDTLNERIIAGKAEPVSITSEDGGLVVTGWAVDAVSKTVAGGVYLDIDGDIYPTFYGTDRKDVADYFKLAGYRHCGFETAIRHLETGPHVLSLLILTSSRCGYYRPKQRLRFELRRDGI